MAPDRAEFFCVIKLDNETAANTLPSDKGLQNRGGKANDTAITSSDHRVPDMATIQRHIVVSRNIDINYHTVHGETHREF